MAIVAADLPHWMRKLPDDRILQDVVLPATHDSGMCSMKIGLSTFVNPLAWAVAASSGIYAGISDWKNARNHSFFHNNFVTQINNVYSQLHCGARQLDLRITSHNFTHRAYHGAWGLAIVGERRYGEKWKDICAGIAMFMAANPTEFLILKLDKQETYTKEMMTILIKELNTHNQLHHAKPPLSKKYVCQEEIQNLRGRVLVCGKKNALKDWSRMPLHGSITLCEWKKDESGKNPEVGNLNAPLGGGEYPEYILLGGAAPDKPVNQQDRVGKLDNVLVKQEAMKRVFLSQHGRTVGMRGIWFNTYSVTRDIKKYSDEIWAASKSSQRDNLWLDGIAQQNVASIDFLDNEKAIYVINKNRHWRQ